MKRYFFDLRKDEALAVDEEGTELPSIDAVQEEAVRSLAEMAKQAVPAALKNGGYPYGNRGPQRVRPNHEGAVQV
jgi:hypothetical protein